MRTFCQINILKMEKKFFSRAYNNLAILVFYRRLQLIQNFLTNGLFPLPRSPSNFEFCKIKSGRGAACWCQTFSKISSNKNNKRRNLSKGENCALLNYYTASSGNPLPTFRDNLSVSSSRVKKSSSLKVRQITCPETSVRNYHYSLHYKPEERSSLLLRVGSLKLHLSKSVTPLKWAELNLKQFNQNITIPRINFQYIWGPSAKRIFWKWRKKSSPESTII